MRGVGNNLLFVLPLVSLLIVLLVLVVYNTALKQQIASMTILPEQKVAIEPYPFLNINIAPDITAQSAIILDTSSKTVLFEKNAPLRFSMASTTKIMTALVGVEYYKSDDVLTIYTSNVEGVNVGFLSGETYRFEDVLYAMLLPSGNDAAYAIADNYPGGVPAFISRMNVKAKQLHMFYTQYADPAGLDDDGNYSNVQDLAVIALSAMKNKTIANFVATKFTTISTVDGSHQIALKNLNKLLGEYGVNGVKTGTTEGAGQVLVTSTTQNGHTFIIVVMKSQDRFEDTKKLLSLISNTVTFIIPSIPL